MNTSTYNRTRWLTLAGTIVTQFALGSVYTWSLFNSALSDKLGAPVSQVAFSFGLLSLGLALSSSVAGKLQERFGVKRVTMASGIMLGVGFFLTAHSNSLMMLWLSAGVLVGLADGAGYLLTLSNCVKWFPERKGLISAFSIGSYGLGSLGFKFIDSHLLASVAMVRELSLGKLGVLGFEVDHERNLAARFGKSGFINKEGTRPAIVIPTNEELVIAQDASRLTA
jgi:OFA family oxalate/formate antiporter-like MFS transporter